MISAPRAGRLDRRGTLSIFGQFARRQLSVVISAESSLARDAQQLVDRRFRRVPSCYGEITCVYARKPCKSRSVPRSSLERRRVIKDEPDERAILHIAAHQRAHRVELRRLASGPQPRRLRTARTTNDATFGATPFFSRWRR